MVITDWLIFLFYRWLALPFAIGLLKLFSGLLPDKMREVISDRDYKNLQALPARPIWIHASSGEIEYAKSVIRILKNEFPQIPILVTYFSPSAKKLIQKFPGIDLAMALPWDLSVSVEKFLNFYKPRAFLVARTDVWPELARNLKKREIPSVLFAATLSDQSSRQGFFSGALTRVALNSLTQIFCVSEEDCENLTALSIETPIQVVGDTRFDQILHRLQYPAAVKTALKPDSNEKIWVCGSTWPEDEEFLIESFKDWIAHDGRVILAPHEFSEERLLAFEKIFLTQGWSYERYTLADRWSSQILLVDQIGCLQELYSWGSVAFVGGSFKDKVHSVMEPLCAGLPVLVGPYHLNNREAFQFQHVLLSPPGLFAVNVVQSSEDIRAILELSKSVATPQAALLTKVQQCSGATLSLLAWVRDQLKI